jgi:hypothetical protein
MTVVINGTTGIDTGTGSLVAADSTTATYLDMFEDTDNGSNYVRLIAPASIAANRTLTLPDSTGTIAVQGGVGVGKILQVIQSTYSTFSQNSSATISDFGLSASITPSSTSSRVIVAASICGIYTGSANAYARFLIDRAGTSLINFGTASGYGTSGGVGASDSCFYVDSPSSTSSLTYKIRWSREGTGTVNANNTVGSAPTAGTSTLVLMEVAA